MVDQEKIHKQYLNDDLEEFLHALERTKNSFSIMPDKQQAWNDLYNALEQIKNSFSTIPKQHAWNDLHRLTNNEDIFVREKVAEALGIAFTLVPDKQQAWKDLHKLTNDQLGIVRASASRAISSSFSHVPDKQQAWKDLHRMTNNKNFFVRSLAVETLGSTFSLVPDKQQAQKDLHRLTKNKNNIVREKVAEALGFVFSQVPDKQQAWNDLHRLTNDEYIFVRSDAAFALGSVFSQVPDKQQAWNDLHRLTNDEKDHVRASSYHSLGRVSIFMASQAETDDDYKKELEKAIEFFEIAARESYLYNPAQFCLPFYRSFHTIVFKKQEAKEEVNKYLEEAKFAIQGSESKKQLIEAVENLAEALKEVQNLENMDLQGMKGELNFYRKYCDRAAELMKDTDEKAPFATEVLRKGLPLLDKNLKDILEEIKKKTELISEQTKGTQFEELANELNQCSHTLLQIRDPVGFKKQVYFMQNMMRAICSKFPEGQKGEACELLDRLYAESSIEDKIPLMINILSKLSYQLDMEYHLRDTRSQLNRVESDTEETFLEKVNKVIELRPSLPIIGVNLNFNEIIKLLYLNQRKKK